MKKAVITLLTLFAVSSYAQDTKLGTVVAIERNISDIYSRCLSAVDKPVNGPQYFFSCAFKYTELGDLPVTQGKAFSYSKDHCQVYAETVNGNLFITFATDKNTSSYEESKACLGKSLEGNKTVRTIIYTIQ